MAVVGEVVEIWRYPVKSMGGERLAVAELGALGVAGDRGWAVRDERAGEIRGAKKIGALLLCAARYLEEPGEDRIPRAEITLPGGRRVRSDAAEAASLLSELAGRPLTLWPRQPREALDHYRRASLDGVDLDAELRGMFGRLPDEPLPDLSYLPPEMIEFTSPLGTYLDACPLHLLSTASLRSLRRRNPQANADVRRFRPSLLVETGGDPASPPEGGWVGRELRVSAVRIAVVAHTPRCVMPTLPQEGLAEDPGVLRTIVRDFGQNLGVYATVARGGRIRVGDPVELA